MGKVQDSIIPSGVVWDYAGEAAPAGWLECRGQAVKREAYPDLFSVIGETYGRGDGETTFNLPDTQGRPVIGAGSHKDVQNLGSSDNLPADQRKPTHWHITEKHTHSLGNHTHDVDFSSNKEYIKAETVNHPLRADAVAFKVNQLSTTSGHSSINAAEYRQLETGESTQPYIVLMKIIKC